MRRSRKPGLRLALGTLVLLMGTGSLAAAAPEQLWTTPTPGFAAQSAIVNGVYIFTDYVFDDFGANTSGGLGGDQTYPIDGAPYHRNGADLVEVRVEPDDTAGVFRIGARLNTVDDPTVSVVAIGIDDGSAGSLSAAWPFGAGVSATGTRYVLTLRASGATLTDLQSSTSQSFPVIVHNETLTADRHLENTFTTEIPLGSLGLSAVPTSGSWVLRAAAGVWSAAAWLPPSPPASAAYDIAYHVEQFENWQQNNQADLLVSGDLTSAAGALDFGAFPDSVPAIVPGMTARVYLSPFTHVIGEGIGDWIFEDPGGSGEVGLGNQYRGLFMPYSLFVPPDYATLPKPVPLFFFMHGIGGEHLSNLDAWHNGEITVKAFTLFPNGAGQYSFYRDEAAADPVLALEDAKRAYSIDDDRIFMSGRSMGGLGTFNIGTLRPDLFAAALPWIGTTFEPLTIEDQSVPGNRWLSAHGRDIIENLWNVPLRQNNGAQDPLVNPSWSTDDAIAYRGVGIDHHVAIFTNRGHEVVNEWQNAIYHRVLNGCTDGVVPGCDTSEDPGAYVRDPNPGRVKYKTKPLHHVPELGLVYDGAYWVDDTVLRDAPNPGSSASVDAISYFQAHKLRTSGAPAGPETRNFAPTNDDYVLYKVLHQPAAEVRNRYFTAAFVNVDSVSFDLARAGLDASQTTGDFDGDGVSDGQDNCPTLPNPAQVDRGGIDSEVADGIGDRCQCGDVTGNGIVDGQDANAMRRNGLGLTPNPVFVFPLLCDTSGDGVCDGQDADAVTRQALGVTPNPVFRNGCANLTGGWVVDLDSDGASTVTFNGLVPNQPVHVDGLQMGLTSGQGSATVTVPAGISRVGLP